MITILLLLSCLFVYGQSIVCEICIIGSTCADDYIHFNVSVSDGCEAPVDIYVSYDTDIDSEKHYLNQTIDCRNCKIDLTIETVRDAWDYTLTLESPKSTDLCAVRTAHCGGQTSRLVWIGTLSLSGLFIVLGGVLCTVRFFRTRQQIRIRQQKIDAAVINS